MIKYIKLDSILNYVSSAVKEQTDTPQILQYANQAWRRLQLPNIQYDLKVAVLEVNNHKATLPSDLKRIVGMYYTTVPMPDTSFDLVIEVDDIERKVMLQQQLLLSSPWSETFRPLQYVGQNRSAIIDNDLYCKNCGYGFSVDAELKCLTIDKGDSQSEPYDLIIEYFATISDEDCNILIPDNENLKMGLAAFASALVFRDMADRRIENSQNRYADYLTQSQNLLNRFRGQYHLMNVQPALHEQFRNRRFSKEGAYWNYNRNIGYLLNRSIPK